MFNLFKKKNTQTNTDTILVDGNTTVIISNDLVSQGITSEPIASSQLSPVLNLTKGDVLDLTKSSYDNIELCAGWDMGRDVNYDLDLFAVLIKASGSFETVYYSNKQVSSVRLHGDNTTGEGDGDDEVISVTLSTLPSSVTKIVFGINIFNAGNVKKFKHVKNAYVRIKNLGGSEICRYNLSEDTGNHSAVIVGSMIRTGNTWNFEADGTYLSGGSINKIACDITN